MLIQHNGMDPITKRTIVNACSKVYLSGSSCRSLCHLHAFTATVDLESGSNSGLYCR